MRISPPGGKGEKRALSVVGTEKGPRCTRYVSVEGEGGEEKTPANPARVFLGGEKKEVLEEGEGEGGSQRPLL